MVDITLFKLKVEDSTFNAPFGGRALKDGAATEHAESGGPGLKLIGALGGVVVVGIAALAFLLKRRMGGSDEEDEGADDITDFEDTDEEAEDENNRNRGAIAAIIGLVFLIATAAIVKLRRGDSDDEPHRAWEVDEEATTTTVA